MSSAAGTGAKRQSKSGYASVREFIEQGGVVTCLICTNRVTSDICSFCGSTEFNFMSQADLPKMPNIKKSGFLYKEGGEFKTWLERYFILFEDGILGYYTSDKMEIKQLFEPRGKLRVKGGKLQDLERGLIPARDGYLFALTSASKRARTYIMEARTYEEREEWMRVLVAAGAIYVGTRRMERVVPGSIREGFLTKQGGRVKTWKRRYFVLANVDGQLQLRYYTPESVAKVPEGLLMQAGKLALGKSSSNLQSSGDSSNGSSAQGIKAPPTPKGVIPLNKDSIIEREEKKAYTFAVRTSADSRRYLITAYDARERECWMAAICGALGLSFRQSIGVSLTTDGFTGAPTPVSEAKAAEAAAAVIAAEGDHIDTDEPAPLPQPSPTAAGAEEGHDSELLRKPPAPLRVHVSDSDHVCFVEMGGTPAPAHMQLFSPEGASVAYMEPEPEKSLPYAAVDAPAAFSTAEPPFSPLSTPGPRSPNPPYGVPEPDAGGSTAVAIQEPISPKVSRVCDCR